MARKKSDLEPTDLVRTPQDVRGEMVRRWKSETGPALEEIRRLVQVSGLSQREVEERAGFSKGYLSQLLARNLDLKVWHVLAVLDALKHSPGGFFAQVYPARRFPALERFQESSRPLSQGMDEVLGRLYEYGVESLNELRGRLTRCERAVTKLEDLGFLEDPRARDPRAGSGEDGS